MRGSGGVGGDGRDLAAGRERHAAEDKARGINGAEQLAGGLQQHRAVEGLRCGGRLLCRRRVQVCCLLRALQVGLFGSSKSGVSLRLRVRGHSHDGSSCFGLCWLRSLLRCMLRALQVARCGSSKRGMHHLCGNVTLGLRLSGCSSASSATTVGPWMSRCGARRFGAALSACRHCYTTLAAKRPALDLREGYLV